MPRGPSSISWTGRCEPTQPDGHARVQRGARADLDDRRGSGDHLLGVEGLPDQTADNAHSADTIKLNKSGQVLEEITSRGGIRFAVVREYDAALRLKAVEIRRGAGETLNNRVTYSYDTAGL